MEILRKSATGLATLKIETQFFEDNVMFLTGDIDSESALDICKQIAELAKRKANKALLVVNSHGGSIQSGMAIYDAIWTAPFPISTYCPSEAYSMGAVIVASGSGERIMAPHAKLMLHEPLVRGVRDSVSASSMKALSESLEQTKEEICEILQKHTGQSREALLDATGSDHYYKADEAIAFGLVDKIGGTDCLCVK